MFNFCFDHEEISTSFWNTCTKGKEFIPNDEWKEYEELCKEIGFPVQ